MTHESKRDKLARTIIDEALRAIIAECQTELAAANRDLATAQAKRRAWRKHGEFDHIVGMRALAVAQIEDLVDQAPPAGRHLEALQSYLAEHHPPQSEPAPASNNSADP